jgi:hypothetical protein
VKERPACVCGGMAYTRLASPIVNRSVTQAEAEAYFLHVDEGGNMVFSLAMDVELKGWCTSLTPSHTRCHFIRRGKCLYM